jgi:polysaccharide transporter, PST family
VPGARWSWCGGPGGRVAVVFGDSGTTNTVGCAASMRQTLTNFRDTARLHVREWAHVARNAGWLAGERVLRLVLGIVVSVAVARHLGPSGMGELGLALGWAALLAPFATLCLDDLVIRELVTKTGQQGEVMGTALLLRLVAGVVCVCVAPFAVWLVHRDVSRSVLVAVVTMTALWGAADVFTLWFHHKTQMRTIVRFRAVVFVGLALLRLLLVKCGAGLMGFAALVAVETGLCAAIAWALYSREPSHPRRFGFSTDLAVLFVRQGWPLMLSGVAVATYLRLDQVLLPLLAGDHEAGLYSAALRISEAWYVVPTALTQSAMPRILARANHSSVSLVQALTPIFRTLVAVAYVAALGVSVLSPLLVRWLFGEPYAGAASVLVVHVWAGVFVALGTARSIWDAGTARTRLSLVSVALGAVVNLGLNVALIPRYGAVGAAVATLVAYAFATFGVHLIAPSGREVGKAMLRALVLLK